MRSRRAENCSTVEQVRAGGELGLAGHKKSVKRESSDESGGSQFPDEGWVQQRLLQCLLRGVLLLVEAGGGSCLRLAHGADSGSVAARCFAMPRMINVTERIRPRAAGR